MQRFRVGRTFCSKKKRVGRTFETEGYERSSEFGSSSDSDLRKRI